MSATTLVIFAAEKLVLDDAVRVLPSLKELKGEDVVGLLYDPASCRFARLNEDGRLIGPTGDPIALCHVFEARFFNGSIELRWLKDPSNEGNHRAVILAETEIDLSPKRGDRWERLEIKTPIVNTLEQTYLLWGEGTRNQLADGWSELGTPRIGAIPVPISGVRPNARVLLHTREYLAEYDNGNVAVFDERLLRLGMEVDRG